MGRVLQPHELVERSIVKKYRKELWNPFIVALKEYQLINAGDKVGVCISGGKDSMLMAKLIQQLQKVSDVPFEAEYIVMNPGYNAENKQRILDNAELLHIPIKLFETDIFSVTDKICKSPCYLCARMRRGHLYQKARELGCNKIALGHHFNDVIETLLLSIFYGAQLQSMPPKLHSTNFEGMELIRPLYRIHENAIIAWKNYNHLEFIQCACRLTEKNSMHDSKRAEIKQLIQTLKQHNPNIEKNIFNSVHTVSLDTFVRYKSKGNEYSFLDTY